MCSAASPRQLQGWPDRRPWTAGPPGRSGGRRFPGITAGAWQMRPLSRGYVEARSPNPGEAPAINPRCLSDPTARRATVGGLRFVRRLFAAPPLGKFCGAEILPGRRSRATTNWPTMRARQAGLSITRPAPER
jgi:choline dehydrogenase